jgi:hypothetical protein
MTDRGRSIEGSRRKMHPLFVKLYLVDDPDDDPDDEPAARRVRRRLSVPRKRITQGARRNSRLLA